MADSVVGNVHTEKEDSGKILLHALTKVDKRGQCNKPARQ